MAASANLEEPSTPHHRPKEREELPGLRACGLLLAFLICAQCQQAPAPEHSRSFDLRSGDFLRVVVEQLGADVVLELHDPGGRLVARVDSPNGAQGVEDLAAIAERAGNHLLHVRFDAGLGEAVYRVAQVDQRPANSDDRALVAADRLYREGRALAKEGDRVEAAKRFRSSLAAYERLAAPAREGLALSGLCALEQDRQTPQIGAAICDHAAERLRGSPGPLLLAAALHTAAYLRLELGQPERAVERLTAALELYQAAGADEDAVLALGHLVAAYQALGRLQLAVQTLEEVVRRNDTVRDPAIRAATHCDVGNTFLALYRPQQALDHYQQALAIYRELKHADVAVAIRGLGRVLVQSGDLELGQRSIEEALADLQREAEPRLRLAALTTLGGLLRRRGDFTGGRAALEEAVALARSSKAVQREATALLELGYLEVEAGAPLRGLELLEEAQAKFVEVADPMGEASASVRGSVALRDLGRLEEAWARLEPALTMVDLMRTATDSRNLRTAYFAFRQDYFDLAIDLLMRLDERQPTRGFARRAFEVHEGRLARELLDAQVRTGAAMSKPVSGLDAEREDLEGRLQELALLPVDAASDREIEAVLTSLDWVDARARAASEPPQALLRQAVPDLDFIQRQLLDQGTILLAFSLGNRRSVLWKVTQEDFRAYSLPGRLEIEHLARGFAEETRSPRLDRAELRASLGWRLSRLLLAPVAGELGQSRLLLVPQGVLQAVPWAALPEPEDSREHRYLVERHEIAVLPSVATLAAIRERPRPRRGRESPLAAFADAVYRRDDSRLPLPVQGTATPWARLPHTREEADAILTLSESKEDRLESGFAASRETLEQTDWSRFSVLHFATHAEVHPEHPELSGLVLSLFDAQGRARDGFLRAFEISRLSLGMDLVVLSACETGVGEEVAGEGMASLARAFFEAGARGVVSSLWRVSDRSTARLMARFYEGYRGRGLSPAAALAEAQRALLVEPATSAPHRWAGFVVQGEGWDSP